MSSFKTLNNIAGWLVFAIAAGVLGAAAEPTGSLWDCGEFVAGAFKLQVVHPPGAPIFLLVGRLFAWVGSVLSSAPEAVAHAVNILSAVCTAAAAMFICWGTTILAKLALLGREADIDEAEGGQKIAILGAGIVAGLTTAFCSSVWFSAVEGEVYAMSTFFTCMVPWAALKWYNAPNEAKNDRWLVFALYAAALSIGVHLLPLLTFPAIALLYYFKKSKQPTVMGSLMAFGVGLAFVLGIQVIIITGIPNLWAMFDRFLVNSMGMPFNSGLIPLVLLYGGGIWWGLRRAKRTGNGLLQKLVVAFAVMNIAYLSFGMVIVRSMADTPINMNTPSDPVRLLPYLNREQYGERPILRGPHFDSKPVDVVTADRWGRVGNKYAVTDQKIDYEYDGSEKMFFPRMQDYSQGRPRIYRDWIEKKSGAPTFGDNIVFFFKYQIGWMYWRYFMWNFAGRQNGEQGYYSWDPSSGNWISGFNFLDEGRIGDQSALTDRMKADPAKNKYYLIPFFLGLLGLFFQWQRRPKEFAALLALFLFTGLGIIIYSNEPPNEPRERDYVLIGSFITYSMWIGMGVLAIFDLLWKRIGSIAGPVALACGLAAPAIMVTQNWDDHSRATHYASRDYASNFLNSVEPNAIIFTYGDNDTYPLWYCQEVEGIRRDVRVVNLSLIAVDWYIENLRRKVNDSAPIKLTLPTEKIRGFKRVQIPFYAPNGEQPMTLAALMKFLSEDHPVPAQSDRDFDTYLPSRMISIPVDKAAVLKNGVVALKDSAQIVPSMNFMIGDIDPKTGKSKATYITKDDLAILDIINSNLWERPIYWAVTCREDKLQGLQDYLQLEGLSLRIVPIRSQSQDAYGIVGSGRVATDQAFKNMTEKWKWGNFNKEKTFIDRSYQPSIQTMRVAFIRVARELMMERDTARCVAMVDKYFEAFPQINFAFDNFTTYLVQLYVQGGQYEKAKEKIRAIADETAQTLTFLDSQEPEMLKPGRAYGSDYGSSLGSIDAMQALAREMKDDALAKELEEKFKNWSSKRELPGVNMRQ